MSEYVYLYRMPPGPPASPQEMQGRMQTWMKWMKDLETKGALVSAGHPLGNEGGVVKDKGAVSDGPYAEMKDVIGGYSIVRAESLSEAMKHASGCPILAGGGAVEVRPIAKM